MTKIVPRQLYTADDLLGGFNQWDQLGYTLTRDFGIFRQYIADGGPVPSSIATRLAQAEHDAGIADALRLLLKNLQRPLVGVMGGHGVARNSPAYADIARLTYRLAQDGFLLVTGGGPGVMEAAHLGVAFSSADSQRPLDAALEGLSCAAEAPTLDGIFENDGTIKQSKLDAIEYARKWLAAALDVRASAPRTLPVSLAIPTWLYGAEPTMPFATHYAKYFQNSLREEALVNNSRAGIVYGRGGGGTMREIFQDVERNFYAPSIDQVTPMIFFDRDGYWARDAVLGDDAVTTAGLKVDAALPKILSFGLIGTIKNKKAVEECLKARLRFTVDHEEIVAALRGHSDTSQRNLQYALAADPLNIATLRMNRA